MRWLLNQYKLNYKRYLFAPKNLMNQDPISSFSSRSEDYHKYRPSYPEAIITYLEQNISLDSTKAVADIGSGTGIFTSLLLKKNYHVSAIEPNEEMRESAEIILKEYPLLKSINGTAEATGLKDKSIDLITVAQSFHWFDTKKTFKEFKRIARPGGHVLLLWNILQNRSPFLKAYQNLKNNYSARKPYLEKIDLSAIQEFIGHKNITQQEIYHSRRLNQEELLGYFRSSSYSPLPGRAGYTELVKALDEIFEDHQYEGTVKLEYDAKMFILPLG